MNFIFANRQSIESAFIEYNANNPAVYEYFKKFAFEMIDRKGKASANLIIYRIRYYVEVETTTKDFKINAAFSSRYARKFIADFPLLKDKIETRSLRS
jgi:hypothetical protein